MSALRHPRLILSRLQSQLVRPPGQARMERADVAWLIGYVQRCLRIMPYVRHSPDCRQAIRQGKAVTCTCGLVDAWSDPPAADSLGPDPPPPDHPPG